jgi:hypothetical protein
MILIASFFFSNNKKNFKPSYKLKWKTNISQTDHLLSDRETFIIELNPVEKLQIIDVLVKLISSNMLFMLFKIF